MQKKRTIRICGLSIFCLFFIGICLMPLAMFAATQATVVSEGIMIYKAPDIYVPPTDAEIEESNNTLAGGGFTVETTEDGKGVIRQGISFGGVKGPEIVAAHNSLVGKDENGNAIPDAVPMLRYLRYQNSACELTADIVAVLDLSRTNIEVFGADFLLGMRPVLFGNDKSAQVQKFIEPCTVFDAVTGETVAVETLTLPDAVIGSGNKVNYAIRVILPNYALRQGRNIEFQAQSFYLQGNNEIQFVEFDLRQLEMVYDPETGIKGLTIDPNAAQTGMHLHYIVRKDIREQIQWAFAQSLLYALYESTAGTVAELFIDDDAHTDFSRLYYKSTNNLNEKSITMYGPPSADLSYIDKKEILYGCMNLNRVNENTAGADLFAETNLYYVPRNLSNTAQTALPVRVILQPEGVYVYGDVICNGEYIGNFVDDVLI